MPNPFSASYSTVTGNISPTIQWKVRFDCLFQQWDVLVRPFLLEFIDSVSPLYEVAIWTAGTKSVKAATHWTSHAIEFPNKYF